MLCPHCTNTTLAMTERQGIEIDYCPTCRGIWLDRGELDRLIERAERDAAPAAAGMPPTPPAGRVERGYREGGEGGEGGEEGERGYGGQRGHAYGHGYPRKKKSLLGDLFDF